VGTCCKGTWGENEYGQDIDNGDFLRNPDTRYRVEVHDTVVKEMDKFTYLLI
jgi:hypothetical protein